MSDWGEDDFEEHESSTADETAKEAPELYFGSVDEWVREWLRFMYRRRIDGKNRFWRADWWRDGEAVSRLDALWRAWEHLRQEGGTGLSSWWRDHADYHLAVLTSADGPFYSEQRNESDTAKRGEPLPYIAPPAGMFPDARSG